VRTGRLPREAPGFLYPPDARMPPPGWPEPDVVHFRRPNGWKVVMNFGPVSVALPEGEVLLFSGPLEAGRLGGESTVWLRRG